MLNLLVAIVNIYKLFSCTQSKVRGICIYLFIYIVVNVSSYRQPNMRALHHSNVLVHIIIFH